MLQPLLCSMSLDTRRRVRTGRSPTPARSGWWRLAHLCDRAHERPVNQLSLPLLLHHLQRDGQQSLSDAAIAHHHITPLGQAELVHRHLVLVPDIHPVHVLQQGERGSLNASLVQGSNFRCSMTCPEG